MIRKEIVRVLLTCIITTVLMTIWYKRKLKEDFWIKKMQELNVEIAQLKDKSSILSWDINQLTSQLKDKNEQYSWTIATIKTKEKKVEEIQKWIYYLNKALEREQE